MPTGSELKLDPGYPERPFSGYRSRFSHKDEKAEPGYYSVKLLDNDVDVELTASERVGLHRYRFKPGSEARVVLDLRQSIYDYAAKNLWSRLRLRGQDTLTGMRETRGWAPGRQLYFAIRFSRPLRRAPADEPRGRRRVQGLRLARQEPGREGAGRRQGAGSHLRLRQAVRQRRCW
jgi:putative alpha-1,2-mannosidase